MDDKEVSQAILLNLEEFYPEFLAETHLSDTPTGRMMFYYTMLEVHRTYPVDNDTVQGFVMTELENRYTKAVKVLAYYLRNRPTL